MWRIEFFNMHGRLIGTFLVDGGYKDHAVAVAYEMLLQLHNSTGFPGLKYIAWPVSERDICEWGK